MSRRNHKLTELEVHVRFEASHVASECLANAYEQIVPLVRQATKASKEKTNVLPQPTERQVGGMQG